MIEALQQLDLFQAVDQSFFLSKHWGLVDFFAVNGEHNYKQCCQKCLLQSSWDSVDLCNDCAQAPCRAEERTDGLNGYYSIHNKPAFNSTKNNGK